MVRIVVKKPEPETGGEAVGQPAPAAKRYPKPYSKVNAKMGNDPVEIWKQMTPKQRGFALAMTKMGMSKSDALRYSYGGKTDNAQLVSQRAHHASKSRKVSQYLNAVQEREWEGTITDAPEIRRLALRVLRDVAANGDRDNNRIAAAVALGKVSTVALFSERREIIHRSEGAMDVQLELAARLQAMLGPAQVVDTTAVTDQAQVPQQGTRDTEAPVTLLESTEPGPQV